jgi:hypothetical protein
MRASGALANTPPQRVEFFGIERRDIVRQTFARMKTSIMSVSRTADKG